ELIARIKAVLRRSRPSLQPGKRLKFADLILDHTAREARRGGRTFSLTAKEFDLLSLFMEHPRQVLTRDQIMERVWGYDFEGESNVLEVYIGMLRQKLEEGNASRLIHTVRGVGYVLKES
ncbi:MAG: response regulator transcription factor, partial [Firmicutes bacterium]|nr:response regulator transcription factor [Bacillota bacterium]